ncbi:MAG: FadR family transcriptional regulator [Desulfobacteraceae bacterium]|nr:MAG: FadR family transcriptional regulator [Desulfobacteraceae bacterium]
MTARPLKNIKKESVRVQVFRQLRDQVLRRTWPPGSKIPSEHELSRTMGVSRVSIREGIQHLVSLGILETRHGEGTFVRELSGEIYFNSLIPLIALDETDIFHVLEYRRIIEKGPPRWPPNVPPTTTWPRWRRFTTGWSDPRTTWPNSPGRISSFIWSWPRPPATPC